VLLGDTHERFAAAFPEVQSSRSIVAPGFVSSAELIRIVGDATAAVFPSIDEGFGLPIVEAAFLGVPVITSNRPPMNQLAPECSVTIDPQSVGQLKEAMERLSRDGVLRDQLSRQAVAVQERFSRDNLARSLAAAYRRVMA
jgi:glycosyltransferase involved in cell wall biosynthesis